MKKKPARKKSPRYLVVASDFHCGSSVGLAHPETELSSGNIVGFGKNHHQTWLWNRFVDCKEAVRKIIGSDSAIFLFNGDMTEGCHHGNAEVIAATIDEHTMIAKKCVDFFLEGLNVHAKLVVKGTECHTRNMEDVFAELIKAETGKAKDKWLFRMNGVLIDAAHHMMTSSRKYLEAGALSIHLGNNRLNCADAGHEPPKLLLRGHRHCGGIYSNGAAMIGVTGGFQFLTRYGKKVVTDSVPSPTMLVFDFEDLAGGLPRYHEIKYFPPQDEIRTF